MANPVIAHIRCPCCGAEDATVHREARGRRAYYIRCYDNGTERCGTLQCRGPSGQKYVHANAKWLDIEGQDKAVAEHVETEAENAADEIRTERRRGRSFAEALGGLLREDD